MIPDYSRYDLDQLRQALKTVDAERYPERAAELRARIAQLDATPPEPPPAPETLTARTALHKAAKVLLAVGILDFTIAVAGYLSHPGNSFFFNFTMLLGAAMLWSGNLRAASIVRWLACAYLPVVLYWVVLLARQPLDLNLSYLRLYPLQVLVLVFQEACHWFAALWLVRALGLPTILAARSAAGKRVRDMRIPFALGMIGSVVGIVLLMKLLGSERALRAEATAQQSLGKNYHVYTESLNISKTIAADSAVSPTFVTASVAAWNDAVVMHVPVKWKEP